MDVKKKKKREDRENPYDWIYGLLKQHKVALRKHEWEQEGIHAMEKAFTTCCFPSGDLRRSPLGW